VSVASAVKLCRVERDWRNDGHVDTAQLDVLAVASTSLSARLAERAPVHPLDRVAALRDPFVVGG